MRALFIILIVAATAACATASPEPRAKSLADAAPEPPADMDLPNARAGDLMSLLAMFYPNWPDGDEGNQILDIKIGKNPDGVYQATIIQAGLPDDSIAQTKDVFTFAYDRQWRVTSFQQHRKCYRTGMFEWTARPCP